MGVNGHGNGFWAGGHWGSEFGGGPGGEELRIVQK